MVMKIFVNLPTKDLKKSIAFYTGLGFTINPQFSDETAACVVMSEEIYVMLLTEPKFAGFVNRQITDTSKAVEAINAVTVDSREEVDKMKEKALASGGKMHRDPLDYGWMYTQSIEDPDGHIWEFFWMDPSKTGKQS